MVNFCYGTNMGRERVACKIIILLWAAMAAFPATAQVPELTPLTYKMRYEVTWNGIALGRVRIETKEDKFGYRMSVDSKTRGILNLFDPQRGVIIASGKVTERGEYLPHSYASRALSEEGRRTTIRYDKEGTIISRERTPPDDPKRRPVVPLADANTGRDPLTAFYMLRKTMHRNIAFNVRDTVMRTYDGARLADFTFSVISRARVEPMNDGDKYVNAINTIVTRKPLAGYKDKELAKHAKGDPSIHIYFSADEKFIPLMLDIDLPLGTLNIKLVEISD